MLNDELCQEFCFGIQDAGMSVLENMKPINHAYILLLGYYCLENSTCWLAEESGNPFINISLDTLSHKEKLLLADAVNCILINSRTENAIENIYIQRFKIDIDLSLSS